MKTFNRIFIFAVSIILMAACSSNAAPIAPLFQGNNPNLPQPTDSALQRNNVEVIAPSLSIAKSQTPQVDVDFYYFLPTPCHQLRVEVGTPTPQYRIDITAYSVIEKGKSCAVDPFAKPLQTSLTLDNYPSGHYQVWLNQTLVGEFVS
jgi:hypothetical protein